MSVAREGFWYFNFEYPIERERGLDFHEDLFCPFVLKFDLDPEKSRGRHSLDDRAQGGGIGGNESG